MTGLIVNDPSTRVTEFIVYYLFPLIIGGGAYVSQSPVDKAWTGAERETFYWCPPGSVGCDECFTERDMSPNPDYIYEDEWCFTEPDMSPNPDYVDPTSTAWQPSEGLVEYWDMAQMISLLVLVVSMAYAIHGYPSRWTGCTTWCLRALTAIVLAASSASHGVYTVAPAVGVACSAFVLHRALLGVRLRVPGVFSCTVWKAWEPYVTWGLHFTSCKDVPGLAMTTLTLLLCAVSALARACVAGASLSWVAPGVLEIPPLAPQFWGALEGYAYPALQWQKILVLYILFLRLWAFEKRSLPTLRRFKQVCVDGFIKRSRLGALLAKATAWALFFV